MVNVLPFLGHPTSVEEDQCVKKKLANKFKKLGIQYCRTECGPFFLQMSLEKHPGTIFTLLYTGITGVHSLP